MKRQLTERERAEREEIRNARVIRATRATSRDAADRHYRQELDDKAKREADLKKEAEK